MKVFKVTIKTTKFLEVDPSDESEAEALAHCLGENGSYDVSVIEDELQSNGHDDLEADSEEITVVELSDKEVKYYLDNQ